MSSAILFGKLLEHEIELKKMSKKETPIRNVTFFELGKMTCQK